MLTCPNCQHQQASGNFCGVCGTALKTGANGETDTHGQTAAAADPDVNQQSAGDAGEKVKSSLNHYGHYFLDLLKNPSLAFQTNINEWLQAVITLIITALASSLSIYFLMNSVMRSTMGTMMDAGIPFFSTTLTVFIASIVFMAMAFISTLIMAKAAKTPDSAQTILTQFGSLAVPFAVVNIAAILTGLAGSFVFTLLLLAASNSLLLYVIPALIVYEKANAVSSSGPKVYLSLAAILIMMLLVYVISQLFLSELLSQITSMLTGTTGF